jgi:endonuclease/exonuclease/phosphatase family metal-dependent hydrolase
VPYNQAPFRVFTRAFSILAAIVALTNCSSDPAETTSRILRVATFNVEDVRTVDLLNPQHPRLRRIAEEIREIDPDVILINEVQYDGEGDPWKPAGEPDGMNGRRLAEILAAAAPPDAKQYEAVMLPVNTGIASGFDLNNDGDTVTVVPTLPPGGENGSPGPQTSAGRAYGNDAFGFGMFPGQYGMVLLVNTDLSILNDEIRTFQLLRWKDMPGALAPIDSASGEPWYSPEEWNVFRLSSKSHWDIPVEVGRGRVLHVLASHPTPPAFDGPERRNQFRNHDEIRFWADYLAGEEYIVDDQGRAGGLPPGASFVILGDLNADIDEGSSHQNPIQRLLLANPMVNSTFVPKGNRMLEGLDIDDTAWWGLRVDYVLPSSDLPVTGGAVHRHTSNREDAAHDHFPVWIDILTEP